MKSHQRYSLLCSLTMKTDHGKWYSSLLITIYITADFHTIWTVIWKRKQYRAINKCNLNIGKKKQVTAFDIALWNLKSIKYKTLHSLSNNFKIMKGNLPIFFPGCSVEEEFTLTPIGPEWEWWCKVWKSCGWMATGEEGRLRKINVDRSDNNRKRARRIGRLSKLRC